MWYDWNYRLNDTKFSDWIMCDDERIGGAIINNGTVMYPFLISPFADRTVFWEALFSCCNDIIQIIGDWDYRYKQGIPRDGGYG